MLGLLVQCSSFSPKLSRARAKRVPPPQAGQQQQPLRPPDLSGAQYQAKGRPCLQAWGTRSSGLCPKFAQCFAGSPGCQSLLWQRLLKGRVALRGTEGQGDEPGRQEGSAAVGGRGRAWGPSPKPVCPPQAPAPAQLSGKPQCWSCLL